MGIALSPSTFGFYTVARTPTGGSPVSLSDRRRLLYNVGSDLMVVDSVAKLTGGGK